MIIDWLFQIFSDRVGFCFPKLKISFKTRVDIIGDSGFSSFCMHLRVTPSTDASRVGKEISAERSD